MQKTKTHLTISNISFFPFLLLFSLDDKLGEFYNLQIIKFLVYTKQNKKNGKIKLGLTTSNSNSLFFTFVWLDDKLVDGKLGKFYSLQTLKFTVYLRIKLCDILKQLLLARIIKKSPQLKESLFTFYYSIG